MTARLLVVDDIPSSARLMAARMRREYFETLIAVDGVAAVRAAKEWRPDLILLDVMMPGIDGFEACRRLKADPETTHVPVIMVTALDGVADRLRGLRAGADEVLTKPVDREALLARLKGLLRSKQLWDEWRTRAETMLGLGFSLPAPGKPADVPTQALVVTDWEVGMATTLEGLGQAGIAASLALGVEAVTQTLAAGSFQLIIVDFDMTHDDPLRLIARLRAAQGTRDIPILAIAGANQAELVNRAFGIGLNGLVSRPVNPAEVGIRCREQARRHIEHRQLREDLRDALALAGSDPLTKLANRHYLMGYLDRLARAEPPAPVAALYLDIDHFKGVNDRYGHAAGDRALCLVARTIRDEVRAANLVARIGGEEFVVILPNAGSDQAMAIAERLRAAVASLAFMPEDDGAAYPLTVSVGCAAAAAGWDLGPALLGRADQALYAAKAAGRNCVRAD